MKTCLSILLFAKIKNSNVLSSLIIFYFSIFVVK